MSTNEPVNYPIKLPDNPIEWRSNSTFSDVKNTTKLNITTTIFGNNSENKENLDGDIDAILNDLKENYVKIENAEMMGYKGKKVHIELPSYRNFEGFKFDFFVSHDLVKRSDFEIEPEFDKKSYSMDDISKVLQAMNNYMVEYHVTTDLNMDYKKELWEGNKDTCNAGEYLKSIVGLKDWFWLKDKDVAGKKGSRAKLASYGNYFGFSRSIVEGNEAHLFLKLSN